MSDVALLYVNAVRCLPGCIHGQCVGLNQCECEDGWEGSICNQRMYIIAMSLGFIVNAACTCPANCTDLCQNGGECIAPDQCSCTSGWSGDFCEQRK